MSRIHGPGALAVVSDVVAGLTRSIVTPIYVIFLMSPVGVAPLENCLGVADGELVLKIMVDCCLLTIVTNTALRFLGVAMVGQG